MTLKNALSFTTAQQPPPPVGQGVLIIQDSRSHSDTPQTVGLLWTGDQPIAETSTWQHTTLNRNPCPPVGFEPTIPASERSQTYALDRVVTGTGNECTLDTYKIILICSSMFQSHFRHLLWELHQN
jgi:hypothetical protein